MGTSNSAPPLDASTSGVMPAPPPDDASDAPVSDGAIDARVGACCGQPEPVCAPGICCVAADCAPGERCLHHACQVVAVCDPVHDWTYYVDPIAGDDASGTGGPNCPLRTLAAAFALMNSDRTARATVTIVNEGVAPLLGAASGETFPIRPPANVTIVAQDPSQNLPIIRGPNLPPLPSGFALSQPGVVLSALVIEGGGITAQGSAGALDHVTVQHCTGAGIVVSGGLGADGAGIPGSLTIGPGVVVRDNSTWGLFVYGYSRATVRGGRGRDHTSFNGNRAGIVVRDVSLIEIQGTFIDPAHPDASDVDTDDNLGAGLAIGPYGLTQAPKTPSLVVGLHSSGNLQGIELKPCARVRIRGCYSGKNQNSSVFVATDLPEIGDGCANDPGAIDLGDPTGPDYGRNIFQGSSAQATICLASPSTLVFAKVLAAGNVINMTDCAVGGRLSWAPNCYGPGDIGGPPSGGGAIIDVSSCK
jgi:hypothetical protein